MLICMKHFLISLHNTLTVKVLLHHHAPGPESSPHKHPSPLFHCNLWNWAYSHSLQIPQEWTLHFIWLNSQSHSTAEIGHMVYFKGCQNTVPGVLPGSMRESRRCDHLCLRQNLPSWVSYWRKQLSGKESTLEKSSLKFLFISP